MDLQERAHRDYEQFVFRLAGDPAEDLSTVFTHVRTQARRETQTAWANRWTTRALCELGLHLLHQRHFGGDRSVSAHRHGMLFPHLRPDDLVQHAATVIRDQSDAEALSKQRLTDTWGHQSNYIEDAIAYLFRSGPYVLRTRDSQLTLTKMTAAGMKLGEFIRAGAKAEIESNLDDPLAALQMFVETALPTNPTIQEHARRLDETTIGLWARLYERVFPAYGLRLRAGIGWHDLSRTFTVVAHGILMRARLRDDNDFDRVSSGDDVLSTVIIGMLPTLFEIERHEIEARDLQDPVDDELGEPAGGLR